MSLSRIQSVALVGLEGVPVEIEVDVTPSEKMTLVIVGLPDTAVRESKDRVLTALKNSGFSNNPLYITINLAPGDLKKEGALYDLPIALGLLGALKIIQGNFADYLVIGELSLSGELRPIQGALVCAMLAKSLNKKGIILPAANAREAASLPGIEVYGVNTLNEAVQLFKDPKSLAPVKIEISDAFFSSAIPLIDFADIKGQQHVKRAMEIAVSGNHNIVLTGPPGSGKTMIAKAMVGIMPELTVEEALEVTKIHSVSGNLSEGQNIVMHRPFRSPHHTISYAGLIGGGTIPRPGEVSLAHGGILFLDELPEFSRSVLEVLRQPLEDRKVTISRAQGSFTFPSDFICVAAMNPCPCGFLGHPDKTCKDTESQILRYQGKISGPLWDRLDMHIEVPALKYQEMVQGISGENSTTIRQRVKETRKKQFNRFKKHKTNGQMSSREIREHCQLDAAGHEVLRKAVDVMGMSARACDRLLKVALTIADMSESHKIDATHLMEALAYRKS